MTSVDDRHDESAEPRTGTALISPSLAGQVNRARVLQSLYDLGPLSRSDLARLTGATRVMIGTIVQPMLDSGILAEGKARASGASGGKPARPLWFSPSGPPIAAVHIMPGRIDAALIGTAGDIRATASAEYAPHTDGPEMVVDHVVSSLRRVLPTDGAPPLGVGIAVGGMVNTDTGTIVKSSLAPVLTGLDLGPAVTAQIGLPVHLDHHPRAQALGDRWFGQGRGVPSFASIYLADVLGVGLVLDGAVQRGGAGAGGEVGHTTVQLDGLPCHCGQRGCWETIATDRWLREQAARLALPAAQTMTAGALTRLAERGHPGAADLLDTYARNIALGIANLQQVLAPGLYILHGHTTGGGDTLRRAIEHHVHTRVLRHPGNTPRIVFADPQDHATLLGAAGIVLSHALRLIP
ncbi:ROK family protein [Streptomyces ferrugineus]|uniref:ROK family protein n=1 Tax=Streptomyces ferrugineus TaxID=1413221 RepID=A0A7M2SA28_9ACTN|nr:ROK family protein [Streptomyces ferrugineus]QOV33156.1 ROK family protein [Streptomyces ferrugineus]